MNKIELTLEQMSYLNPREIGETFLYQERKKYRSVYAKKFLFILFCFPIEAPATVYMYSCTQTPQLKEQDKFYKDAKRDLQNLLTESPDNIQQYKEKQLQLVNSMLHTRFAKARLLSADNHNLMSKSINDVYDYIMKKCQTTLNTSSEIHQSLQLTEFKIDEKSQFSSTSLSL